MAPEDGSPGGVECLERHIFLFEPSLKGGLGVRAEIAVAEFVVDLPADHRRMIRVLFRHRCDDAPCVFLILEVVRAVTAPVSKP